MRAIALLLMLSLVVCSIGCAKKSASEQLADDMNKAAKQMNRDMQRAFK